MMSDKKKINFVFIVSFEWASGSKGQTALSVAEVQVRVAAAQCFLLPLIIQYQFYENVI